MHRAACSAEPTADGTRLGTDHDRRVRIAVTVVDEALVRTTAARTLVPETHRELVVVSVRVGEERDLQGGGAVKVSRCTRQRCCLSSAERGNDKWLYYCVVSENMNC